MALGWIEIRGTDIYCTAPHAGGEARLALDDAAAKLSQWSSRYDEASRDDREDDLVAIGREMFEWLDLSGWASEWASALGERELEIRVGCRGVEEEILLLDAPWEILSDKSGPLAQDPLQLFNVARRIGEPRPPQPPLYGDLQIMFMAAAPEKETILDFEAEESAILVAARNGRSHLIVEETGALDPLGDRL